MAVTPFGVEVGIQYRIYGPDGTTVCFNTSASTDFVGYIEEITGLDGPDTRESAELIVEGDGGIHGDFFHGRRPITISGIIDPNAMGAARNTMISNLLTATNAMRADAILEWTPTGGDQVRVAVRRQQPPRISGTRLKTFQISLIAADPRVYSTAARSLGRASEAAPGGIWGHVGDGEYDAAAIYSGPSYHLPLGSPGGLTNGSTTEWAGDGTANGGMSIGSFSPGPLVRGENFATDFDGTNDYISTDYATRRNLCPNPSIETNTTGWAGTGSASIFRVTSEAYDGAASLSVQTPGAATDLEGVSSDLITVAPSRTYTVSAYVKAPVGTPLTVLCREHTSDGTTVGATETNFVATGSWQQVSASRAFGATGERARIQVRVDTPATAVTFYVDAALVEGVATAGTYFPTGAQLASGEAGWLGTANNSASDIGCFANGTVRTFMGWVKRPISGADYDMVFAGDGPSTCRFYLTESSNWALFEAAGSAATVSWAAGMNVTSWVHFAVVFNEPGNLVSLYVNGALISSQALSDQFPEGAGNLKLGSCWAGVAYPFKGQMRSFSVFPRGLSANEIRWLYEKGARAMAFNRGNADSPVVMRVTGPITNPTIYNQTTGQAIFLTGAITGGNWIEIDTATGEIVNQAGANVYSMFNFATSNWWDLKPGVNDFYLVGTGTSGATRLDLSYKDAWI